jgi:hypothetical protein
MKSTFNQIEWRLPVTRLLNSYTFPRALAAPRRVSQIRLLLPSSSTGVYELRAFGREGEIGDELAALRACCHDQERSEVTWRGAPLNEG